MLGSIIHNRTWRWTAVGKHPAATDYIQLEGGSSLLNAVSDWMAKGYEEINRGGNARQGHYSWRFWLRGVQKGGLICGLACDSSDRIGRPFPLLIMGEGMLKGWEKTWDALPMRLAKTWGRMEFIASHRYDDAQGLAAELRTLTVGEVPPADNPPAASLPNQALPVDDLAACAEQLRQAGRAIVGLNNLGGLDPGQAAIQWHQGLKSYCSDIPRAVFLGGTPHYAYLAVLQHPLNTADFVKLWTL